MELKSKHRCFGGEQRFYTLQSASLGLPTKVAVYLPPQALDAQQATPLPALVYLAGLTCTEETAVIKAGAQRVASELGLILIFPDTSPRGANIPGEDDSWDFGSAAGFYLDATQAPWNTHYRMESFIIGELLPVLKTRLPISPGAIGITGHSMGGHGALTLALKHPGLFKSLSAFAPICAPSQCPWGEKAFTGYLGDNRAAWLAHDAAALMSASNQPPYPHGILIDQGLEDQFLDQQLHPHLFEQACKHAGQPLQLRRQAGYDHGYYFISTFMEDHLRWHHAQLV